MFPKQSKSNLYRGLAAMVLAAFVFAIFGFVARYLEPTFGVFHQLWVRTLIAAALGICLPMGRKSLKTLRQLSTKQFLNLTAQAFLIYPLGALTWIAAVQMSPLATVAFITALPTEAIWGMLVFGDRLGRMGFAFLGFAVVGLWLIVSPTGYGGGLGELLALLSSFGFSLGMMLSGRQPTGLPRLESTIIVCLLGSAMVAVSGFLFESWKIPDLLSTLVLIISGGLILLNFWLLNYGFQKLSGALAGTVLMLEVVFAGSVGYLFFGETLSSSVLLGGSMIVGSAIGILLHERRLNSQ